MPSDLERLRARLVSQWRSALSISEAHAPLGGQLYSEYVGMVIAYNDAIEQIDIILNARSSEGGEAPMA